jgi:hypothetical protein
MDTQHLDQKTKNTLRIAFTIYNNGKDGSFWLEKACQHWNELYGTTDVHTNVWEEITQLIDMEFSQLKNKHPRLANWVQKQKKGQQQ